MRNELGAVALPGARAVVFEQEPPNERLTTRELDVIRRIPPDIPELGPARFALDCVRLDGLPNLNHAEATALSDATLLLSGVDQFGVARAFRIDVGRRTMAELDATRAPSDVLALADATVVELDNNGASIRRLDLPTPFDSPPATIFAEDLSLDAVDRWDQQGARLVARANYARADLATLRFGALELEIAVQGVAELLFLPSQAPPVSIRFDAGRVGPVGCKAAYMEGDTIQMIRRGRTVDIITPAERRRCTVDDIGDLIGVAIRADDEASFQNFSIRRL